MWNFDCDTIIKSFLLLLSYWKKLAGVWDYPFCVGYQSPKTKYWSFGLYKVFMHCVCYNYWSFNYDYFLSLKLIIWGQNSPWKWWKACMAVPFTHPAYIGTKFYKEPGIVHFLEWTFCLILHVRLKRNNISFLLLKNIIMLQFTSGKAKKYKIRISQAGIQWDISCAIMVTCILSNSLSLEHAKDCVTTPHHYHCFFLKREQRWIPILVHNASSQHEALHGHCSLIFLWFWYHALSQFLFLIKLEECNRHIYVHSNVDIEIKQKVELTM